MRNHRTVFCQPAFKPDYLARRIALPGSMPNSLSQHRGGIRLIGPLSFVETIKELHDGLVVFARKDKGLPSGFETLGGCLADEVLEHQREIKELVAVDGFMTINRVLMGKGRGATRASRIIPVLRYYRRRVVDLEELTAAYVDLDCGKLGLDPTQVLDLAVDRLNAQGQPLPTHACFSGSGLWFLWRFLEPVHAWLENSSLLKRLNQKLVHDFAQFGADPNSTDAARVMRCAETINSKNGRDVRFFRVLGSERRTFQELILAFHVPAQKTSLAGERKSSRTKNPRRVAAGKLRYSRRHRGFLQLREIRGFFKLGTRRQAIFGLALLLFKNGVAKKQILVECENFARKYCRPPITDGAEIRRRVEAAFRYREHISDAKFAEWFRITPAEMAQLPDWFRPKQESREPRKARIARRRALIKFERRFLELGLSNYKQALTLVMCPRLLYQSEC